MLQDLSDNPKGAADFKTDKGKHGMGDMDKSK